MKRRVRSGQVKSSQVKSSLVRVSTPPEPAVRGGTPLGASDIYIAPPPLEAWGAVGRVGRHSPRLCRVISSCSRASFLRWSQAMDFAFAPQAARLLPSRFPRRRQGAAMRSGC